ncbi:MAG: DUF935 family protein [Deltaproteobacteria bacterium]|nr:DUF935 family protein [Deltaproteobacteria bacterium]
MKNNLKKLKNLKSDSRPAVFSSHDLRDLLGAQSRHLSFTPALDFLNVSTVRQSMNEALRGAYAQVQWIWEQLEPADAVLASCVEKRETALKKLPWRVVKKKGLSDLEDAIADAQLRTARDFCNAITNLDEAIAAFGQASFRHYKRIQMLETERGLTLLPTDNWNWSRDGYNGEWQWNPGASFGLARAQEVPVPECSILTRVCPRPIDQVAMMLCLDRKNAKAQWMTFNGRYGTPPFFVVLPEGTDEETKELYIQMAVQCVSNSCGTLPPGADVKAVTVPAGTPDMFLKLIDLSTQELVLRSTNGQMTMLTAPGAGTTSETGSTHESGFDDLAAAEGATIAGILNRGMLHPVIEQWHPGQEIYVELEIKHPEADDTTGSVANITQLAAAGYRTPDDQVQELTGYNVSTQAMPGAEGGWQNPAIRDLHARYAPTMLWPAARDTFMQSCRVRDAHSRTMQTEPALSAEELEALCVMGMVPDMKTTSKLAEALEGPLKAVLGSGTGNESQNEGDHRGTPRENANLGGLDGEKDSNGKMSRSEAARHAARVRWAQEGKTGRNRGIGREGETKSSSKSNTPLKAGAKASTSQKVDAVEKAIRKTANKGGSVKTGVKVGKNELTVDGGHKDYFGAKHAERHFTPKDTSPRKAARAAVVGRKSKDARNGNILSKHRETITVMAPTDKKRTLKMITAHKKKQ